MSRDPARRVLIVTSSFPRWRGDSTTPFVHHLAEDLADRQCEVRVLAPHAPGASLNECLGRIEVRRFRYLFPEALETVCYGGGALIGLRKRPMDLLKVPALVLAELASVLVHSLSWRPDVIHAHWLLPQGFVAALAGILTGIPVIVTIHGGDVFALRHAVLRPFKTWALRRAAAVTVNSSATEGAVRNLVSHLEPELIPTGIDPRPPAPALVQTIRHRHRSDEGPLLVFVGRLVEEKGVQDLIAAVPLLVDELPGLRVLVVGEGQDRRFFERQARELGVENRLDFVGWVSHRSVASYMAAADVFVGPSRTSPDGWLEAQGLTFAEALMAGTVVVATPCGGIGDLIRHEETGLLVPEGDPTAIAGAVRRLHDDPGLGQKLVKHGREAVLGGRTRASTARRFVALFQRVTEGEGRAEE